MPMHTPEQYLKLILRARVYDVARETALDEAPALSRRLGCRVLLKREDTQPVFSYKLRGAYNLMASLGAEVLARGVITASAGNHAQGVALAARRLGCHALIVMPKTTPEIKIEAVRRLGAEICLHGNAYDEASHHAHHLAGEGGRAYIPPYDHPLVIAGQGTVGMEICRQHSGPLHAVFVPVGGGGLLAGVGLYLKQILPEVRIIGVEPADAASLHRSLAAGRPVALEHVGGFADGAAVRQVGEEPFRVARDYGIVDEVLVVSTDEICAAIKDIFEDTRAIAEPAGALAVAGLKQYQARRAGATATAAVGAAVAKAAGAATATVGVAGAATEEALVAIVSGANVNFDRLRHIAELAELGEGREMLFAASIPERPGSFRSFCHAIGARQITEFNYRYSDRTTAQIFVGVHLRQGGAERREFLAHLTEKGYPVEDLSGNELAKLHVRHMVGGHAGALPDERLFRFEFPERAGALLHFLLEMGERWNISLFHYRNHGAADGRVLLGIQIPAADAPAFATFLAGLGPAYSHAEETENPAYGLFLR
jgi:threonine dehydratase